MRTFVIFVIIVFISICSVGMYRPGDVDENSLLCPRLSVIEIGKKEYAGIKAGTLDSLLFSFLSTIQHDNQMLYQAWLHV